MSDKPKRVLTPEHLEKLKIARIAAQEAKSKNMEVRKIKKENDKMEKDEAVEELIAKNQKLKSKKLPVAVDIDSEALETSKDEESDEEVVVKKKKKKKPKKKVIVVEESDTSSEDEQQVIYIKKPKKKIVVKQEPAIINEVKEEPIIYEPPPVERMNRFQSPRVMMNPFHAFNTRNN